MLITVDIGNTHSVFGLWNNRSFVESIRISTDTDRTSYEWFSILNTWVERTMTGKRAEGAIVSSVVPAVEDALSGAFEIMGIKKIAKITSDLNFPFSFHRSAFPTIGVDRLVNAAAGVLYYGQHLIIVDLGTAITFCQIINNRYLGGVIAPGIQTSLSALSKKAAKLFEVSYRKKKEALAQATRDSLESGIYYGWKGLIKEIIMQLKKEAAEIDPGEFRVIATGGVAADLGFTHEVFDIVDPNLTLRGLMEMYFLNYAPENN